MEIRRQLFQKDGAISGDEALKAQQEYLQNLERIADFKSQLKGLNTTENQQAQNYSQNLTVISDLQGQLQQLVSQQVAIAQQEVESEAIRKKQIQDIQREIIRLEMQLSTNNQIVSQHNGRILEVNATPGQVLTPGTRLATIEAENPQSKLVGVTYFPVGKAKKIHPGMSVQIIPEAVKQNFGGIVGTVTNISNLPITKAAAVNKVGNPEVVEALVGQQQTGLIQVVSELNLDPNTPSGYKWSSSQGPDLQIASGNTTVVRAKVEERAPISFVLPILRSDIE
ncbi:hypothetical protein NSMS1_55150 [Nostoc sp. MS1]|nr:hypothetical protein NSMS1_55150 [Nostoc sp. MS1]